MLELYELNVFVQAAEALSFTAAAQRLHISQPAVSMQISNLEKRLNTVLFDRSGRNIRRTRRPICFFLWHARFSITPRISRTPRPRSTVS